MIFGVLLFGGTIWSIAPDAVIEIIVYIIASCMGIYLGACRSAGQRQEQSYYI